MIISNHDSDCTRQWQARYYRLATVRHAARPLLACVGLCLCFGDGGIWNQWLMTIMFSWWNLFIFTSTIIKPPVASHGPVLRPVVTDAFRPPWQFIADTSVTHDCNHYVKRSVPRLDASKKISVPPKDLWNKSVMEQTAKLMEKKKSQACFIIFFCYIF